MFSVREARMYERFRKLSLPAQFIVVLITLVVVLTLVNVVVGIISRLIPLAIAAAVIVGLLWLFNQVRD